MGSTMKVDDHSQAVASLHALIDSLPALIHTGRPDGYLDFFNQRWLQFVGLRLEELEGWKMDIGGSPRRRGRARREVASMPRERRATRVRSARAAGRRGVPVDVAPQ